MDNFSLSPLFQSIVLVFETLQLLGLVYDNTIPKIRHAEASRYLIDLLSYTQFNTAIQTEFSSLRLPLLYFTIAVIFSVWVFAAITLFYYDSKDRSNKALFKYSEKICIFLIGFTSTIYMIPIVQILMSTIICTKGSPFSASITECYKGSHAVEVTFTLICVILYLMQLLFCSVMLNDINPFTKTPFSSFTPYYSTFKVVPKIIFPLIIISDAKVNPS